MSAFFSHRCSGASRWIAATTATAATALAGVSGQAAAAPTVVDVVPPGELRQIANSASSGASMLSALAPLLQTDQSTNMDANGDGKPDGVGDTLQLLKPLQYIQFANTVLAMIDTIFPPDAPQDPFKTLAEKLDAQTEGLGFQLLQAVNDESLANGRAALLTSKTAIQTQMPITADGNAMYHSLEGLNRALSPSAYQRAYSRLPESIREAVGEPDHPNNQQYDWRLGVPTLLEMISIRLAVLSAFDPVWMKNGLFKEELLRYRSALLAHYNKMVSGVRCGGEPPPGTTESNFTEFLCVDIHTGAKAYAGWTGSPGAPQYVTDSNSARLEQARRAVLGSMPLFEIRSVIDALFTLAQGYGVFPSWGGFASVCKNLSEHTSDPATIEFYQTNYCNRIAEAGQGVDAGPIYSLVGGNYCLDVPSNVAEEGTQLQIYECTDPFQNTNDAQFFSYRAETNEIRHVSSGLCVDVRGGSNERRAPVQLWSCNGSDAQRWTFDFESNTLQNALNTVLDVQWGAAANGTPVWTWSRSGGAAQKWK